MNELRLDALFTPAPSLRVPVALRWREGTAPLRSPFHLPIGLEHPNERLLLLLVRVHSLWRRRRAVGPGRILAEHIHGKVLHANVGRMRRRANSTLLPHLLGRE